MSRSKILPYHVQNEAADPTKKDYEGYTALAYTLSSDGKDTASSSILKTFTARGLAQAKLASAYLGGDVKLVQSIVSAGNKSLSAIDTLSSDGNTACWYAMKARKKKRMRSRECDKKLRRIGTVFWSINVKYFLIHW